MYYNNTIKYTYIEFKNKTLSIGSTLLIKKGNLILGLKKYIIYSLHLFYRIRTFSIIG